MDATRTRRRSTRTPASSSPARSATAALRRGDVLLIDEAGMLDQDTARALLTIADEHHARVALVGDRHQLPAVGRGGVLDLAARWAAPGRVSDAGHGAPLHAHRHDARRRHCHASRTTSTPSSVSPCAPGRTPAWCSMRCSPATRSSVHATEAERGAALAADAAKAPSDRHRDGRGGRHQRAGRRAQRARSETGSSPPATSTTRIPPPRHAGQRIGVGDRVTTRRNDPGLDVANRDTWTVTRVAADGRVLAHRASDGERDAAGRLRA